MHPTLIPRSRQTISLKSGVENWIETLCLNFKGFVNVVNIEFKANRNDFAD